MNNFKIILFALLFGVFFPCLTAGQVTLNGRTYFIELPSDTSSPGLFIWFHGGGMQAIEQFNWWKATQLPSETIMVAPQSKNTLWSMAADEAFVDAMIGDLKSKYNISRENSIIGGFSSGAVFSYEYGFRNMSSFSHFIIASGTLNISIPTLSVKNPDFYLFHSVNDDVFSYSGAQSNLQSLLNKGYLAVMYTDTVGHNLSNQMKTKLINIFKTATSNTTNQPSAPQQTILLIPGSPVFDMHPSESGGGGCLFY
jgi:hypothetical protein